MVHLFFLPLLNNCLIVITFYSPSCLGQETAKGPFGLWVKLPLAHLSTTLDGGFTLSFLLLNVKQGSSKYQFYSLWFQPTGNWTRVYYFSSRRSIHSTTVWLNRIDSRSCNLQETSNKQRRVTLQEVLQSIQSKNISLIYLSTLATFN